MLVQKSAQNDSIKDEAQYVALESAPKFPLQKAQKIAKKCDKKHAFDVADDSQLDGTIKGAPWNLRLGSFISDIA